VKHPEGLFAAPDVPTGAGVLVLTGSSGLVDAGRVRLFTGLGAAALSIRWFGGPGQQPDTYEVPLETFFDAVGVLKAECDRVSVVGTSFGAEAALLAASHDPRIEAVVAVAPTPVVWAGVAPGDDGHGVRQTSHWTLRGAPVPFVSFVQDWEPPGIPPAYRELYLQSIAADPAQADTATIPVERIAGDVVVIGGEDDQVWPGAQFARMVADRRATHGLLTTVVTHDKAGHRAVFPGEQPVTGGRVMARGGSPEADADLGALAWPHVTNALRLQG